MAKRIIILGQGLAGSTLAMRLCALGKDFLVIDNGRESSSTEVAAGMWNPIVFRKLNKTWRADDLVPELEKFYSRMEETLKRRILNFLSVNRVHSSNFEANLWLEKRSLEGYNQYLGKACSVPSSFKKPEHGASLVHKAGFVDLIPFLEGAEEFLLDRNQLRKEEINEDSLLEEFDDHLIFDCRGYKCADSKWWSYLPFGKTKGEVLTIQCADLELENIFNAGFFVCPLGNDTYRLGATFNWEEEDEIPTQKAREELLKKLRAWTDKPIKVLEHRAGIRPTVADRRPLIGRHPEIENLYIFNGLGTKGVMIAPYLSKVFLDCVFHEKEFPLEVNIERWTK